MLGRTANSIFWMFRYLERAENTARLLEAGFRMALTRGADAANEEWRSVIVTLGEQTAYQELHSEYSGAQVCNFVLRDRENPQNVLGMIEAARANARSARTSITAEVWEAVNEAWMVLGDLLDRPVREASLGSVLASIRREATLVRGATYGSMLRNEIYHFARAGTFLERADNTARILDVKYYLLLPSLAYVGSSLDTGQWDTVLRSLSAERAYRWLNAGRMDPRGIAEFLILDRRFPRSLAFCYDALRENLKALAELHHNRGECHTLMREADRRLCEATIDSIFDKGLHEFLTAFISENEAIATSIATDYRFIA
ncbi:alpha-E domain-containing protein [Altererythrobacter sp. CC-YST694]|uniref:alpha-E domain-containing protein n=1 Tax=Altererythrobacter sp. CC-YST694 TaxID=2755038 RepID=UPI001D0292B6|nr:alpha-E domain-containing protein [Altererythrobacter sp. CC-YST694]MCB5423908.1 alpha-E domain-containing protein [Altererythrobacter sp. CC-YST694]